MTESFDEEQRSKELIEMMIEIGALEILGYDKKSESFTYSITPKMKELIPEFFEEHLKFINEIAFTLWNKGYVEIYFEENGPLVMLKETIDYPSILDTLEHEERLFIESMLSAYKNDII
jgi:cupin superfamily acireductone dioxygenase involved in methionine salvage